MYEDIPPNFDIHHKKKDGTYAYAYAGQCKECAKLIREKRTDRYKQDITLYVKKLVPHIRCRALKEELEFNLDELSLVKLWKEQQGKCFYTGEPLNLQAKQADRRSPRLDFPSVDKMIPELGYVVGNVVWCSWRVNRMKNSSTKNEFVQICQQVVDIHG